MNKFSEMKLQDLMKLVAETCLPEAAVWLELRVYLVVIDLAHQLGWRVEREHVGAELFRHAGRIALAKVIAPERWADCNYCILGRRCSVCLGMGSLNMSMNEFESRVGQYAWPIWRKRLETIERTLVTINGGKCV
jgi:hypothetical protein